MLSVPRVHAILALVSALCFATVASSQVNVTTYHNDNSRTGQNTSETSLTMANVNSTTFGKLFTVTVDGQVYAQPLVLSSVTIGGGTHNVVYVATENDSVYAIDAGSGTVYWRASLGSPEPQADVTPGGDPDSGCKNINPQYGITATPVIDPTSGTIYVVAETGATYQLHALNVGTGAEKFGGPVTISGTYDGIAFNPLFELIRPGLLLDNGQVFIGAGSHCDNGPWYGWLFSYNATTLKQDGVFNTEPSGHCAGVWMSGGGVAADSSGNVYLATGNSEEYTAPNYGDSVLKMTLNTNNTPATAFSVASYFTPSDANSYGQNDTDVGAGGVLLIPGTSLLTQMGKPGALYLMNTSSLGGFCSGCSGNDTNIVQEINHASVGMWGAMAYWNNSIYFGSANYSPTSDSMKAYSISGGRFSTGPTSTTQDFGWPSPTPSISSNGTSNGIVWAVDNSSYASSCCAILHAFPATNLGVELYNSNMVPADQLQGAIKFAVPTVANGKVYVGGMNSSNTTEGTLSAFGAIPNRLYCSAAPTCSVQGQAPYQEVTGQVVVTCNEDTIMSASAKICGSSSCSTNSTPSENTTSIGAGGASPGAGGSCTLNWTYNGNNYGQTLDVN
jgi:hypothetical protein